MLTWPVTPVIRATCLFWESFMSRKRNQRKKCSEHMQCWFRSVAHVADDRDQRGCDVLWRKTTISDDNQHVEWHFFVISQRLHWSQRSKKTALILRSKLLISVDNASVGVYNVIFLLPNVINTSFSVWALIANLAVRSAFSHFLLCSQYP